MSKELETLEELKWLYNQDFKVKGWHNNGELEPLNNFIDNFYEDVLQSLTPPTEEEVCEVLSEYYGKEVIIDKRYKNTVFAVKRGSNVAYMAGNKLQINQALPPYLVELVAKYYKGEIK